MLTALIFPFIILISNTLARINLTLNLCFDKVVPHSLIVVDLVVEFGGGMADQSGSPNLSTTHPGRVLIELPVESVDNLNFYLCIICQKNKKTCKVSCPTNGLVTLQEAAEIRHAQPILSCNIVYSICIASPPCSFVYIKHDKQPMV